VKDVVCLGGFFSVGDLVREAKAGIGFSGPSGGSGRGDADGIAGDLQVVGRGDDDDAVNAAAPVGEGGFLFSAGAAIANGLEQQGGFNNGDRGRLAGKDFVDLFPLEINNSRMNDGVEFLEAPAGEGELGEAGTVELAAGSQYLTAEGSDYRCEDGLAGLHELAAKGIGLDDVRAALAEHGGGCGFAAAEAAGEAYT